MSNAQLDDNSKTAIFGISCVDGVTPVRIAFNASNGGMKIDTITVISIVPTPVGGIDENGRVVAKGVSSTDSSVILPWYVNPATNAVLVEPN